MIFMRHWQSVNHYFVDLIGLTEKVASSLGKFFFFFFIGQFIITLLKIDESIEENESSMFFFFFLLFQIQEKKIGVEGERGGVLESEVIKEK